MRGELIWNFETANYSVRLIAEPEDYMDLSWDETGEVREGLESGHYCAFVARVVVVYKPTGAVIGEDYLGGCIYETPSAFMDHRACGKQNREYAARGETARCGSYFSQMVSDAVADARKTRAKYAEMKLRD